MLLKYVKSAYISKTQYGWHKARVTMKVKLVFRPMKGFVFIHATTLCKLQEKMRKIAVTDTYQPYTGAWVKINVP